MLHFVGVEQYLVFFQVATYHGNLGHTTCRQQTRTYSPIGQSAKVKHRRAVGRKPHNEQFSQNRRLRAECRLTNIFRQRIADCRQFLRHNLPVEINIRPPVELNPYHRESCG